MKLLVTCCPGALSSVDLCLRLGKRPVLLDTYKGSSEHCVLMSGMYILLDMTFKHEELARQHQIQATIKSRSVRKVEFRNVVA